MGRKRKEGPPSSNAQAVRDCRDRQLQKIASLEARCAQQTTRILQQENQIADAREQSDRQRNLLSYIVANYGIISKEDVVARYNQLILSSSSAVVELPETGNLRITSNRNSQTDSSSNVSSSLSCESPTEDQYENRVHHCLQIPPTIPGMPTHLSPLPPVQTQIENPYALYSSSTSSQFSASNSYSGNRISPPVPPSTIYQNGQIGSVDSSQSAPAMPVIHPTSQINTLDPSQQATNGLAGLPSPASSSAATKLTYADYLSPACDSDEQTPSTFSIFDETGRDINSSALDALLMDITDQFKQLTPNTIKQILPRDSQSTMSDVSMKFVGNQCACGYLIESIDNVSSMSSSCQVCSDVAN